MKHASLQIIHDEHSALAAMLRSMTMMVTRGPEDKPEQFFDVLRAMLFYIDEFPERLHHPRSPSCCSRVWCVRHRPWRRLWSGWSMTT